MRTTTRIHLMLDHREWRWEIAGNLTPEQIAQTVAPVEAAHSHTSRSLTVSRNPRWVGVATTIADRWLAVDPAIRFAAYALWLAVALCVVGPVVF